jgi:hypothetical protein
MWALKKADRLDEELDELDLERFIQKMRGDTIPERLVTFDKRYSMAQFSSMIKTMLISLEILAERINNLKD